MSHTTSISDNEHFQAEKKNFGSKMEKAWKKFAEYARHYMGNRRPLMVDEIYVEVDEDVKFEAKYDVARGNYKTVDEAIRDYVRREQRRIHSEMTRYAHHDGKDYEEEDLWMESYAYDDSALTTYFKMVKALFDTEKAKFDVSA